MKIHNWRKKIDAIDTAMLHLLNLRTELALEVGKLKGDAGLELRVPGREHEILSRIVHLNSGPLDDDAVAKIYQLILNDSTRIQELNGCGRAINPEGHRNLAAKNPQESAADEC